MKQFSFFKKNIFLITLLTLVAFGVGSFAYTNPAAPYPANTDAPIDTSLSNQIKTGGLSVNEFVARGNAQLQQNATFKGTVQGGYPGDTPTAVIVNSDTIVTGEVHTKEYLGSGTLAHNDATPRPLCNDGSGNIVFCTAGAYQQTVSIVGSLATAENATFACSDLIGASRYLYTDSSATLPQSGARLYTDSALTVPLAGNLKWYRLRYSGAMGERAYAVQINGSGTITSSYSC